MGFISGGGATLGANTFTGSQTISGANLNLAKSAPIASDPTLTNVWGATGNLVPVSGVAVITDFPDATQAGMTRLLEATQTWTVTNNANITVFGGTRAMAVGDLLYLIADTVSTFIAIPLKANGQPNSSVTEPYIYIRDEKASGTDGGTFTTGAWRTRDLNTEVVDTGNNASVAANQITLAAGTYRFRVQAPAFRVAQHQVKLVNITDTIAYIGTSAFTTGVDVTTSSWVEGRFTIAAPKVFEVQHQSSQTRATDGFGAATGFAVNCVYTEIELWKEV